MERGASAWRPSAGPRRTARATGVRARIAAAVLLALATDPCAGVAAPTSPARVYTLPVHVYKVKDGLDSQDPAEAWYFRVVVADSARGWKAEGATIRLYSGARLCETRVLPAA